MWILPSRLRPHNIKRFIEGWTKTKSTTKLVLALDKDDPTLAEYQALQLPATWKLVVVPKRLSLMAIYNWVYARFPFEPWYGILDDDYVPETKYWDVRLVDAAGKDKIAYPKNNITGRESVVCPVIPRKWVWKMGWVMPPFTKRLYGDNVWTDVGTKYDCLFYQDDIEIRHYHFSNGLAPFDETYRKPSAAEDHVAYMDWLGKFNPDPLVNFVCVDSGNYLERGDEYVSILHNSVTRNLSTRVRGRFICFTDRDNTNYPGGVQIKKLPLRNGKPLLKGWWAKLYLFKHGLFKRGERVVYFDLDTVVAGGIDALVKYRGEFAMLRDFYRPDGLGSGVMIWTPSKELSRIWETFEFSRYPDMEGGDQAWIENRVAGGIISKPDIMQDLFPEQIVSYKVHAKWNVPKTAKVVCFHGQPRPHEVTDGWVPDIWKVGGGSVMEFDYVPNVPEKLLNDNISYSTTLPYEVLSASEDAHDNHLVIVGGGPSLADCLDDIRMREKHGQVIWALNNSFKYLKDNGINPHGHVILDAREKNAYFVPEQTKATLLYASICHPKVFERAAKAGGHIIIWHPLAQGLSEKLQEIGALGVTCGDTVGLKALGLAYLFGFRKVHLYGYDSSYAGAKDVDGMEISYAMKEAKHHAFPQELNDGEKVLRVTVNGRKFFTAPWMASQTEQFKELVQQLVKDGMAITVHGDGLLPYVASLMGAPLEEVKEAAE